MLFIFVLIFRDKPTKTDKSVYDAVSNSDVDVTKYPYVYRWRHTVSLYTPKERDRYFKSRYIFGYFSFIHNLN